MIERFGTWLDANPRRALLYIAALATVMGLARIWHAPINIEDGQTDNFWPIANHLLDGQGYTLCYPLYFPFCPGDTPPPTAIREPVPVFIFAAVAAVTGRSLLAAVHIQLLMCVLLVFLTFRFVRAFAGDRAALLAAFAWAIYLPALEIQNQLSSDLIATALFMGSALMLMKAARQGSTGSWIISGALLGLAAISRSAYMLMLLPWCVYALWSIRGASRFRSALKPMLLIAIPMMMVMSPWAIRNKIVFGKAWLGTSMNGNNVFRNSYQVGTGEPLHFVGSDEAARMNVDLLARRKDLKGTENEAEMDKVYMEEGMPQVKSHPMRYLQLCAYRLFLLCTNIGVKQQYGRPASLLDHTIVLQQVLYLGLALIGMFRLWRSTWPWILAIGVLVLGYIALVAQTRYMIQIIPIILMFSATALARLLWRGKAA